MGSNVTGTDGEARRRLQVARVVEEVVHRRASGEHLSDDAVIEAHADLSSELREKLNALQLVELARRGSRRATDAASRSADNNAREGRPAATLPSAAFPEYELTGEVHRGGQAVVYRATQTSTGRDVAIKVMHEGPFVGSRGKARFEREVRILGQIKHPNIVTIHDSGNAAGSQYFVMDYISGEPFNDYVATRSASVRETLRLFVKICEAVEAAQLLGVIHRDLKPANILIDEAGEPQILDFGLAKADLEDVDGNAQWRSMTVTGQFVGSLPWASPEQADGTRGTIDLRTDVYSLGVTLFQALTGRFPYSIDGSMRQVLGNIIEEDPVRPSTIRPQIDDEVETILLKSLAKDPNRRYQSAGELARDIGCYLSGEPIEAKRESTLYVLRKRMHRYRTLSLMSLAIIVVITASSLVAWSLYIRSRSSLWESQLAQARAHRTSGTPGRRFEALKALTKAAAIRPSIELRNEAIAAMALTDVRVVEQWTPESRLVSAAFDANLEIYAVWKRSELLSVRRVSDDQELLRMPGPIKSATISEDGRLIAFARNDVCEVWELENASLLSTIPVHAAAEESVEFSPDTALVAVGAEDGSVHLHDLDSGLTRVLKVRDAPVNDLAFHPTRPLLATSSVTSPEVVIRNLQTGEMVRTLSSSVNVWGISWSPNGELAPRLGASLAPSSNATRQ